MGWGTDADAFDEAWGGRRGYCATCRSAASADSAVGSAPGMSASSGARAPGSDTDAGSGMLALSYTTTSRRTRRRRRAHRRRTAAAAATRARAIVRIPQRIRKRRERKLQRCAIVLHHHPLAFSLKLLCAPTSTSSPMPAPAPNPNASGSAPREWGYTSLPPKRRPPPAAKITSRRQDRLPPPRRPPSVCPSVHTTLADVCSLPASLPIHPLRSRLSHTARPRGRRHTPANDPLRLVRPRRRMIVCTAVFTCSSRARGFRQHDMHTHQLTDYKTAALSQRRCHARRRAGCIQVCTLPPSLASSQYSHFPQVLSSRPHGARSAATTRRGRHNNAQTAWASGRCRRKHKAGGQRCVDTFSTCQYSPLASQYACPPRKTQRVQMSGTQRRSDGAPPHGDDALYPSARRETGS